MKIYAIVPVKHLDASKRRLASVLKPEDRRALTLAMLEDVLNAIKGSLVQETVVVSNDLSVSELATNAGVLYKEEKGRGLNRAITGSIKWCLKREVDAVVVLPADIPLVSSIDINRIIEIARNSEPILVLSPSENGGTNALYMRPPDLIPVNYGPGSFKKHIKQSRAKGTRLKVYYAHSIAFDIDSQKDLQRLSKMPNVTVSAQLAARISRNLHY